MENRKIASALIVDDSEYIRNLLGVILKKENINVHYAENGAAGMEKFLSVKPDLVFADIIMPGINGLEMLKEIKRANRNAVVIVLTSLSAQTHVTDALEAGADYYVLKPFTPDKIREVLQKFL
jgi:two-component system chemotaxis response regulator CheY